MYLFSPCFARVSPPPHAQHVQAEHKVLSPHGRWLDFGKIAEANNTFLWQQLLCPPATSLA